MSNLVERCAFLVAGVILLSSSAGVRGQSHRDRPRQLVPGVITTIREASIDDSTIDAPGAFTELLQIVRPRPWEPAFDPTTQTLAEMAQRVGFQREVWSLEFGFKPLRLIRVGGQDIWYLVYFVRNTGDIRTPSTTDARTIEIKSTAKAVRFVPSFILQAHGLDRAYRDRLRPDVVSLIAEKERVSGKLHDSSAIRALPIQVSDDASDHRVWGVATWDNVDPRTDYISVFVQGLTNAYRWSPPERGYDSKRPMVEQDRVMAKALQLNFWRAGDETDLEDREIVYGIPLYPDEPDRQQEVLEAYQLRKPVEHQWVYR